MYEYPAERDAESPDSLAPKPAPIEVDTVSSLSPLRVVQSIIEHLF